jgi:eukaryotic translation initiation factor 2C
MLQIPCHRLLNPVVLYDQSRTAQADATSGRWDPNGKNFLRNHGRHDFHFVFLVPNTLRARDTVLTYAAESENQIQRSGMGRPRQAQPIQLAGVEQQDLAKALQTASSLKQRPNVVILLLPAKNIAVYSPFSPLSDRVFGLQSIVVTEEKCLDLRSLGNRNRPPQYRGTQQYMVNIMMKANLKTGGVNHASQLV